MSSTRTTAPILDIVNKQSLTSNYEGACRDVEPGGGRQTPRLDAGGGRQPAVLFPVAIGCCRRIYSPVPVVSQTLRVMVTLQPQSLFWAESRCSNEMNLSSIVSCHQSY